jgi:hypothetical protein
MDANAADNGLTKVWVQITTGGAPYPPTFHEIFVDPIFRDIESWPMDHPAGNFIRLFPTSDRPGRGGGAGARGRGGAAGAPNPSATLRKEPPDYPWDPSGGRSDPGFDVLVLNDQAEWPDESRQNITRAVEQKGKGFVLLHHALGDNNAWPWWYQQVTGGLLVLADHDGLKRSTVARGVTLNLEPDGKHPLLEGVGPLRLPNETAYRGMWQSPKIAPLMHTANAASDRIVVWTGVHANSRVVCIQPGAARETHANPGFRRLVHNAILWAAGRI